jgi:hypothetical protein
MWDWIVAYTKAAVDTWLKWRINNTSLHVGVREGAFALHYAAWLSQALPDSYPLQAGGTATNGAQIRAQLLADVEAIAVGYYGRLQQADGSWRWDDVDVKDSDGGTLKGITQPFMIGLLLLALADVHQLVVNQTSKDNIRNQILKGCRHLYADGPYRKNDPTPYDPSKRWRCFWYLYHGGTTVNPTKFAEGGWSLAGINANEISDARQSIGPVVAAYGYAYKISGDPLMLEAGKELWDAAYAGTDGIRNLMATDGKGFNQNCARAGSFLPWAGLASVPSIPEPTPTTPSPSPDAAVVITSPANGSSLSGIAIVTAEATDPSGIKECYLLIDGTVHGSSATAPYSFKVDTAKLAEGTHGLYVRAWNSSGKAVDSETISASVVRAAPEPEPPPAPSLTPVPEEYRTEPITPKDTEANRTALYQRMFSQGFAAWKELSGPSILFKRFK